MLDFRDSGINFMCNYLIFSVNWILKK